MGGWSQTGKVREQLYMDPSVLPTPAAHAFFGWLLAGAYTTGPPEIVHARGAAHREDVGEIA